MIIARLSDGMGNQMFQYAAGRALSLRRGVPLRIDVSAYRLDPKRRYALHHFNVREDFLTDEEARRVVTRPLDRAHLWWDQPVVLEPHFHYSPDFWRVPDSCCLVGYWQTERYFAGAADVIRAEFSLRAPPAGRNAELVWEMAGTNSVCLHFRRGDYVSDPKVARLHGACSPDYYRAAIEHMARHVADPVFYVFSDEIDWVKANLRLSFPTHFIDHNRDAPTEDLRLMSRCRHHILANSSFSWWGAWLAGHAGQQVCAPQRWFAGYDHDTRDLTPSGWLRLPG